MITATDATAAGAATTTAGTAGSMLGGLGSIVGALGGIYAGITGASASKKAIEAQEDMFYAQMRAAEKQGRLDTNAAGWTTRTAVVLAILAGVGLILFFGWKAAK